MSENTAADIEENKKNGEEDSEEPELSGAEVGEEEPGEDVSAELEALRGKYLRLSADFDNYKKRLAKEKQEILDFGNAHRLKELLFVLDNIERAIELSEESHGEKTDFVAFLDGIKIVHSQFLAGLENFGVTGIDSGEGTVFNPSYHEAVYKEHSETCESGTIISEVQKGYLLNGRLLRPSMVSVSQGPEKTPEKDSEEEAD
ncbi:MAG: nucleotide exchange factor GrpE [Candidatus Dadabacteria bacterium]|nr:nucleotide exchange factor GrpE [Candidatus Dadabacteria bacterium]MDE0663683.1 nucleotide exchange factor GrpE [Candidatus Dadabacteria bacterium]